MALGFARGSRKLRRTDLKGARLSDPTSPAVAAAARLRLLQADLADQPATARRAAVMDELRRATADLSAADADGLLDAVAAQFPAWGRVEVEQDEAAVAVAPDPEPTDLRPTFEQWHDPSALIAQLSSILGADPDAHVAAQDQLRTLVGGSYPDAGLKELQRVLQLTDRHPPIDPGRATDLLMYLLDFVRRLETFVNPAWNAVARGVGGPAPKPLAEAAASFLVAADESARTSAATDLAAAVANLRRRTRVLIATLRAFSQQHADKFAPGEIEGRAEAKLLNKQKAYWETYVELCGGRDREMLEAEVNAMYVSIISRMYAEVK